MDWLARNLDDLRRLVRALTGKGMRVEFVKENLTFTGEDAPMATLLLSVMGPSPNSNAASTPAANPRSPPSRPPAPPTRRRRRDSPPADSSSPEPIQDPLLCGSQQLRESQARNGQTRAHPQHH
jgi:hypothetical protein